jgi:hypothetical protein
MSSRARRGAATSPASLRTTAPCVRWCFRPGSAHIADRMSPGPSRAGRPFWRRLACGALPAWQIVTRLSASVGSHAAGMLMAACAVPTAAASASSCLSRARVSSEKIASSKLDPGALWQAASAVRPAIPAAARNTEARKVLRGRSALPVPARIPSVCMVAPVRLVRAS